MRCRAPVSPLFSLGLADAVHPANGLELMGRVQDGFHQQNMSGLDDVESVGTRVQGKEQDIYLLFIFERAEVFLKQFRLIINSNSRVKYAEKQQQIRCLKNEGKGICGV